MLATTGADELAEAMAYQRVEPWGEGRADVRAAQICLTVYQMLRAKESPQRKLSDFILEFGDGPSRTPEEIVLAWQVFTVMSGGTCG